MLVDPESGALRAVSHLALAAQRERVGSAVGDEAEFGARSGLEQELFLQQIETGTAPLESADALWNDLISCRREAAKSAGAAGAALISVGAPVLLPVDAEQVTPKPRYERIVEEFGEIGRQGSVCGMHVHVDVADDDEGVRVIDGLRPWLPVLRAMSVNSPFFHGRDTGYASWRSQVWGRWPSAGPSQPFVDPAGYHSATEALVESGAAFDLGGLYFDARLSRTYPTIEVRVFDAMTELDDVVLLALLTRALVSTIAGQSRRDRDEVLLWRHEMLRAAHWRASRYGLDGELLNPLTGRREAARDVVDTLVATVTDALRETGDLGEATMSIDRLGERGTGATRQRAAAGHGGGEAVVADLRERFDASLR